ncbi:MAG: SPOR domain-containing protein [Candidatus Accumulibacter sp.]|jgi:cell division protein FtsN|nr:SPOR domain-containing protein [Accumulibacter sp.]
MPNENPDSGLSPPEHDDSGDIRRKLVWRMGIAGLMIAILLGGLAVFDHLAVRSDESESTLPRFTDPVPVTRRPEPSLPAESSGPVLPAPLPEEDPASVGVPEASAPPAAPVNEASPDAAPPEEATPVPAPSSSPVPASRQRARTPRRAAPAPPAAASEPARQRESPETPAPPGAKTIAKTPTQPVPIPGGQRRQPLPPRLFSGYTFQAGVFTDPRRAEDVRARLAQEGIPVTLETRVLVGPFKDRKEADSARAKMKAMGIEALMVPKREGR